jgi:hypothetical protein
MKLWETDSNSDRPLIFSTGNIDRKGVVRESLNIFYRLLALSSASLSEMPGVLWTCVWFGALRCPMVRSVFVLRLGLLWVGDNFWQFLYKFCLRSAVVRSDCPRLDLGLVPVKYFILWWWYELTMRCRTSVLYLKVNRDWLTVINHSKCEYSGEKKGKKCCSEGLPCGSLLSQSMNHAWLQLCVYRKAT